MFGSAILPFIVLVQEFIIWDGVLQQIDINASESTPLVGMAMLYGYRVQFDAIEGGTAMIQAINP